MPTIETCGHFHAVRAHFQGQTVKGGFSMDNPPDGGVGAFVAQLGSGLTPRHASFICAILQHGGLATTELKGVAVHVSFPAMT
jgi:hypothetical protein